MSEVKIEDVRRAFSPAKEIEDPKMFAGRSKQIKDGIKALLNEGGFMVIHGLRGVGKTSIANQLKLIAEGDDRLPSMMGLDRLVPQNGFGYRVQYVRCDAFVKNIVDLIERILFADERNESLFSLTKTGERKVKEIRKTVKGGGSIQLPGVSASGGGTKETTMSTESSNNIIQKFREVLNLVKKDLHHRYDGLLIIIDEFDAISNKEGFSSLVKTCSSEFVKFGVVGIANNISELISDHKSIGRQIDIVRVPTMSKNELTQIIKKAEHKVNNEIYFSREAKGEIAKMSEEFPYFTHLMGQECMMKAFEVGKRKIGKEGVDSVSEKISKGKLRTNYEDIYHDAVKQSEDREILLKLFAEEDSNEISTSDVYGEAKEMGMSNPSQLMKELTGGEGEEGVLKKVRPKYYRFTDPVFKVYARKRGWKFDADETG